MKTLQFFYFIFFFNFFLISILDDLYANRISPLLQTLFVTERESIKQLEEKGAAAAAAAGVAAKARAKGQTLQSIKESCARRDTWSLALLGDQNDIYNPIDFDRFWWPQFIMV